MRAVARLTLTTATLAAAAATQEPSRPGPVTFDARAALRDHEGYDGDRYRALTATRNELRDLLRQRRREERPTAVARQAFTEARWLLASSCDFDRAARRFADVRRLLDDDGAAELTQVATDGSFGPGYEEWAFKLHDTVDRLILLQHQRRVPEHPLRFLERVDTPDELRAHLERLLVSDPRRGGVDHRKLLSYSVSGLLRLVGGDVDSGFPFPGGLRATLLDYLDTRWQDPDTGCWGAWYRDGDRVVKTTDLSITFHIVSYRDGEVGRWPQLVDTVLAMRDADYPFGWREDGARSLHHSYDAATILRLGWPHMTEAQRNATGLAIDDELAWCLCNGLRDDGTCDETGTDNAAEALYFTAAFLDTVGYFDPARRFWADVEFPRAGVTRRRLVQAAWRGDLDDPHTWFALGLLGGL